ncbi:hypothetical protein FRC07_001863 [Ceratobasidium sp. 392]|nr:hypothetical protein FRC07_001863 [Ceratobasidium sp. 392]
MPATDPHDQLAARTLETELCEAVARRERPQVKLNWFSVLPKRIQRSARLIEAAQAEAKVLLNHVSPDAATWNGLGRRKRRCRAFDAIGHAFATRRHVSDAVPAPPIPFSTRPTSTSTALDPLLLGAAFPVDLFTANTYVYTPAPLWQAAADLVRKVRGKEPFALPSLSETRSPNPSYIPPPVTPHPLLPQPPPRLLPTPLPPHPTIPAYDRNINSHLAWIIARGQRRWCLGSTLSLQEAANSVVVADAYAPSLLGGVCKLLFPGGVRSSDQAVDSFGLEVVLDLCAGWYEVKGERA